MKTKEIDVWVYRNHVNNYKDMFCKKIEIHKPNNEELFYKAKLILEIPEKKIEITEKMLDDAFLRLHSKGGISLVGDIRVLQAPILRKLKKELGL